MTDPEIIARFQGVNVPLSPYVERKNGPRLMEGRYERHEWQAALALIRPGERVVEMGAGIGFVGGLIAANVPDVQVRSFEGNPHLIPHIRALYRASDIADRIEVANCIVTGHDAPPPEVTFHIHRCYLGSSLIKKGNMRDEVTVPTQSFASIVADFAPSVLVMDIEGGEEAFLHHADLSTIRCLVIELHPDVYGKDGLRECKQKILDAGLVKVPDHSNHTIWAAVRPDAPDVP